MAKFRTSHHREKHSLFSAGFKLIFACVLLVILFFATKPFVSKLFNFQGQPAPDFAEDIYYLPAFQGDEEVISHPYFTIAYKESIEQAKWVAYILTVDQLNAPKVSRTDYFSEDPSVKSGSATYEDYLGSGYSRGHLVPAADRAYDPKAMEATFLMSNVSPQVRAFNGGVWRELEENVRDWARSRGELIIVTGPIFKAKPKRFGNNQVAIPSHFFKVVLDIRNQMQGVGFVIPNRLSEEPLDKYVLTIDSVEAETGLDFFHELLSPSIEEEVESTVSPEAWHINPRRYQWRIEEWNKR